MKFEPHGEIDLVWENDTLNVSVCGPVNREGAISFNHKIESFVVEHASSKWARIEHLTGEEQLGTNDAFDLLNANLEWSQQNGCQCIVLVNATLVIREVFSTLCADLKFPMFTANNLDDARAVTQDALNE